MSSTFSLARIVLLAAFALPCATPAKEITLPAETARLKESALPGYSLAVATCMTCHSVDYVRMQPPAFTRATWKASVTKMQKAYGAQFPDTVIDPIAEYLAKTYGAERAAADSKAAPSASR